MESFSQISAMFNPATNLSRIQLSSIEALVWENPPGKPLSIDAKRDLRTKLSAFVAKNGKLFALDP